MPLVVLKWLLLLGFWMFNARGPLPVAIVSYLLIANLYTYFYYHAWTPAILSRRLP